MEIIRQKVELDSVADSYDKIAKEKRDEIVNFYYKYKNFFSESAQYLFEQFEEENDIFCDILLEMYTYFHAIEIEINPNFEFYQSHQPFLRLRQNR